MHAGHKLKKSEGARCIHGSNLLQRISYDELVVKTMQVERCILFIYTHGSAQWKCALIFHFQRSAAA